jgi:hypothetical protein
LDSTTCSAADAGAGATTVAATSAPAAASRASGPRFGLVRFLKSSPCQLIGNENGFH